MSYSAIKRSKAVTTSTAQAGSRRFLNLMKVAFVFPSMDYSLESSIFDRDA